MSQFSCPVVRVRIEPHPNADAIEIARVGDYQSIVKKGQFQDGELAVYIPEQAVLPEWLLKHMNFWDEAKGKGGLSGSLGNRVRAIKLRGVLSQGLVLDFDTAETCVGNPLRSLQEGEDVSSYMEVVKYEPPIPSHMSGKIVGVDLAATLSYDFENIKKHPDLFEEGEMVMMTEKIHGTFMQIGVVPSHMGNDRYYKGRVIVSSKGLGAKGFILDHTDETNLYIQCAKKHGILDAALEYFGDAANDEDVPYFVCGEVFGKTASGAGVQDLTYNNEVLAFRAFDVCAGTRGAQEFFAMDLFLEAVHQMGLEPAPILYIGPYSKEKVAEFTSGSTFLSDVSKPEHKQIREGVVIKAVYETGHKQYGRKIAKSVSEAYLLRKGETTEFN